MVRASSTWRKSGSMPTALSLILYSSIVISTNAHQSISYPTPISFDLACRIGLGRNCPGPCPARLLRSYQSPNNPAVTTRRGGVLPVHILKNNHVGGFARWSMVPVSDMHSKKKHTQAAFLFTCADVQVTKCTKKNQERDCKVDRLNEYYRYDLRIPKVYPDGYYVLGWLWYGGLVSTGTHGAFGEYWDCVYVEIKGGPTEEEHQPTFHAGETLTGQGGMCRATTNRIGHCFREPCPFGNRPGKLMKPEEFEGRSPSRIVKKDFGYAHGKQYGMSYDGNHKYPELPCPSPSQTRIMKQKDLISATEYTTNNLQKHKPEKDEKSNGHFVDISKHAGKKQDLQTKINDRPKKMEMVASLTSKPAGVGKKKVARQRKLLKKKLRKEKKLQKRKEKRARKARARREKQERKRLMRERIKRKRVNKHERTKMHKQRIKEMKQF